ncbi:uncharacterized protein MONBRDRAFT_11246 [Monosiga brevicollis MX1]|uniref:Thiopurine S-methyltransferase n=1 Tax=Monosiga brevicollis TaxID=81824 RepID=A9V8N0_MONBE|nr:uncharacterized protein MONBRDRAFT_11246 [Monosiga brevicollis MX1]EDQ86113.1 predicted protein [Monosiga brevicollis MX1]|eukprot:XP_001749038.1 hypothetical protein [Monosiga brevicollis MX1]
MATGKTGATLRMPRATPAMQTLQTAKDEATRHGRSSHWETVWQEGVRPLGKFDAGGPCPALEILLAQDDVPRHPEARALVPGCGRGYDLPVLARHGFHVEGWELSETAAQVARDYINSQEHATPDAPLTGTMSVARMDFFEPTSDQQYDLIYDYTFLCALHPDSHQAWARQMRALLRPGGLLVTVIFPIVDKEGGPPFAMSMELVSGLLQGQNFECQHLAMLPDSSCNKGREGITALGLWRAPDAC